MKLRFVLLFCLIWPLACHSQPKEHWVDLTWNASTSKNVTRYKVYRQRRSEKSWKEIGSTAETRFTDHDVEAGETYLYMVSAVAGIDEGAKTKPVKTKIPRK